MAGFRAVAQRFSDLNMLRNLGSGSNADSGSAGLRWSPRLRICKELPGDAVLLVRGSYQE